MIWFKLTLRLIGDLDYIDEKVVRSYFNAPFVVRHRDADHRGQIALPLAQGELHSLDATRDAYLALDKAAARLRELHFTLVTLDLNRCKADLSLSTGRTDAQMNFFYQLPEELVTAAGVAGLALGLSFYAGWPNDSID